MSIPSTARFSARSRLARAFTHAWAHAALLAGLLFAVAAPMPATASAQFTILYPEARNNPSELFFKPVCNARLEGVIWGPDPRDPKDQGDAAKLAVELNAFLQEGGTYGQMKGGEFLVLCLSSPGGDLPEAVKIGKLFSGWTMVVEDGAICESACAVVFMSAAPRDRVFLYSELAPGRFLHFRGRLGFHGPELNFTESQAKGLSPKQMVKEVKQSYRNALQRMRAVAFPDDRRDELGWKTFLGSGQRANAMPPDLLMSFLTVPNEGMFRITSLFEAMSWGIEVYGFDPPPALSSGLLTTACINVATVRCLYSPNNECIDWLPQLSAQGITKPTDFELARNLQLTFNLTALYASTLQQDIGISKYRPNGPLVPKAQIAAATGANPETYAEAFEYVNEADHSVCDVRATWRGDRVETLHLDLVAFKVPGQRVLVTPLAFPEFAPGNISRYHLRPWRMLPLSADLTLLNMPDLWGKMVESGNFFSRPPNWK